MSPKTITQRKPELLAKANTLIEALPWLAEYAEASHRVMQYGVALERRAL